MGLYAREDRVLVRMRGKVRLTDDPEREPDLMPIKLFRELIAEAEGDVGQDLSERYFFPWLNHDGRAFESLPDQPTQQTLRMLAEAKSVMYVLQTDFGDGGNADASKYFKEIEKRYKAKIDQLLEKRKDMTYQWRYPPLAGLRLADHNSQVDDGFSGCIINSTTQDGIGDNPHEQINSPSEMFWNGIVTR